MRLGRGMCYGALSGMLSAHSLLMAKSAVELLVRTIVDGDNQFRNWQAWVILLALVCIGLSQLYCLHSGLQLCSTSVLYPFIFCVYNVTTILNGLIYFDQFDRLSGLSTGLVVLGTCILISGVVCLSYRLADDPPSSHGPEVSESLLTPPISTVENQINEEANERDPLLPKPWTPDRLSTYRVNDESRAGVSRPYSPKGSPRRINLDKFRKRATFADFGTNAPPAGRRAATNPVRPTSAMSAYQRSRRKTLAESKALWGELEEEAGPTALPKRRVSDAAVVRRVLDSPNESSDHEGPQSAPLLQRTGTGRTYRSSRRRQSMPGTSRREDATRAIDHTWHTLDSSAGRPGEDRTSDSWWQPSKWRSLLSPTRPEHEE